MTMNSSAPDGAPGLAEVRRRIAKAAAACGREPADVTLTAVSKQQSWSRIAPVLQAGQRVFGENRVQEAMARWETCRLEMEDLELRLIGPLQTNKAKEAVAFFDVIETLDRERLAKALADEVQKQGRRPRVYIEVNTGEEPQKAGVLPGDVDGFVTLARGVYGLEPEGLMCIPPVNEEPAMHFGLLAKLAERNGLKRLSMGMSEDFETAIRFGSTEVRVGTAIFGPRGCD